MTAPGGPGWTLASAGPNSETAQRLLRMTTPWAQELVRNIDAWVGRYPDGSEARTNVLSFLTGDSESRFRGALWELFWYSVASQLDAVVRIEYTDLNDEVPGVQSKSVDLLLDTLGLAVEVTSTSELDAKVRAGFWLRDLHDELQQHLHAPGCLLHLSVRKAGSAPIEVATTLETIQAWYYEKVWPNPSERSARLRIDCGSTGWVLDIDIDFISQDAGLLVFSGDGVTFESIDQRRHQLLTQKARKKSAVPQRPLMIAVADPGRLLGGGRWGRLNTLVGQDQMTIHPDGSTERTRAGNGFLFGEGEWRNSGVSAIAFTSDTYPEFGVSPIEIWINGGAAHPLPVEPFLMIATIVQVRDGVLMERPPGESSEWRIAPTE